jgi:hypothetical protein
LLQDVQEIAASNIADSANKRIPNLGNKLNATDQRQSQHLNVFS